MDFVQQILEDDEVLTADEAVKILKISKAMLYRMAQENQIPHRRLGSRYLFSRAVLRLWIIGDYASKLDLIEREPVAAALRDALQKVTDKKATAAIQDVLDMVEAR